MFTGPVVRISGAGTGLFLWIDVVYLTLRTLHHDGGALRNPEKGCPNGYKSPLPLRYGNRTLEIDRFGATLRYIG
jgi:hypothetical protein